MIRSAGRWLSLDTPVSSTNKTDSHDITEIFLKVALNIKTLTLTPQYKSLYIDLYCGVKVRVLMFKTLNFSGNRH
jgi:hypothetical protein